MLSQSGECSGGNKHCPPLDLVNEVIDCMSELSAEGDHGVDTQVQILCHCFV